MERFIVIFKNQEIETSQNFNNWGIKYNTKKLGIGSYVFEPIKTLAAVSKEIEETFPEQNYTLIQVARVLQSEGGRFLMVCSPQIDGLNDTLD